MGIQFQRQGLKKWDIVCHHLFIWEIKLVHNYWIDMIITQKIVCNKYSALSEYNAIYHTLSKYNSKYNVFSTYNAKYNMLSKHNGKYKTPRE